MHYLFLWTQKKKIFVKSTLINNEHIKHNMIKNIHYKKCKLSVTLLLVCKHSPIQYHTHSISLYFIIFKQEKIDKIHEVDELSTQSYLWQPM
jgi:hypothetical protein